MTEKNSSLIVSSIESTQKATGAAMSAVIEYISTAKEPTAEETHRLIDETLSQFGCESPEGHIVACGPASAEPHEKGQGSLTIGQPIVIDIYPRSKASGYFADMTRTVCLGQPSVRLRSMFEVVLVAQELAFSLIKPGAKCADIHQVVVDLFKREGFITSGQGREFAFAEGFVHSLGHGIGLDLHTRPRISSISDDVLAVGDVITIEPGLYYKDIGGVRLEDMLLVTEDGYRNLTDFEKNLEIASSR